MHGGTNKGAPKGNRHAWKHGNRSAEAEEQLKQVKATDRDLRLMSRVRQGLPLGGQELERLALLLLEHGEHGPDDSNPV